MRPHGVDGFDFVDVETSETEPSSYVVSWQEKMEERVTKLELQLSSLLARKTSVPSGKKVNPFPCAYCERSFTSKIGKVSHELTKHGDIKPETAVRGDETVMVGKSASNFLGKGPMPTSMKSSAPKKKSNLKNSSPSSSETGQSSRKEKSPSRTPISQKDIAKAFENFQKVIFGLLEEPGQ